MAADTQTRTQWGAIALLFVAGLFAAAQFGKLTLTLPQLTELYGPLAPFLVSCIGVIGIIFGAIAGGWAARQGMVRVLLFALILGAAVSLLQSTLPSAAPMMVSRAIEGFSHLAIVICAPTLMAALSSDRDRSMIMGLWACFFGVSFAILALIMPNILNAGGLSLLFLGHGGGLAVIALVLWYVLKPLPRDTSAQPNLFAAHVAIYTTPRAVIAGAGFVCYTILYIAMIAILPGVLALSAAQTSLLPLVSLIGTFGAGIAARSIAPPRLSLIGFAATAAAMIYVAMVPGLASGITWFLLAGIIPGACFATIPHFNSSLADRARATGAIAQLGNVGTTTGTPLFVMVYAFGGLPGITAVTLAFCALGAVLLILLQARIK